MRNWKRVREPRVQLAQDIPIAQPLRSCLARITVRCTIDCCGTDALSPSPLLVGLWADSVGVEKAGQALARARSILLLTVDAAEPLSCAFLNYREFKAEDRAHFQRFLRALISSLELWTSQRNEADRGSA